MHTERPFFARLQELLGANSQVLGEKFPLTGLDKTLHTWIYNEKNESTGMK
jgi:hypothetical protein